MRFRSSLVLALIFFIPLSARSEIIYLKNGKRIECSKAWEEGKEIKYTISSGTVSIPRTMVLKIENQQQSNPESSANQTIQPRQELIPKSAAEIAADAKTNERLARFYTDRGMDLANQKDYPKALEQFEKAYDYFKNETTTLNLAVAYYLQKDDWNAEMYFHEVLRRNPDNVAALNYLAEMYWKKEELDEARKYWKRSLEVKDDPEIRERLDNLDKEQVASANYDHAISSHFLIKYDGGQADSALTTAISEYLEDAYRQLSALYEIYPTEPFVVILYPRQEYFNVMDMPSWSAGANDGKIKLPVKGLTSLNDELKSVLIHELSHSFVELKTLKNNPVWLQEGLAKYSEGERMTPEGRQTLQSLITSRNLPSIHKLQWSFANANAPTAAILYLESLSFVEYLIDRQRMYQLNQFLDRLGKQESLSEAFENV
jgi:tetratricopeptide (TPR) repeat protein